MRNAPWIVPTNQPTNLPLASLFRSTVWFSRVCSHAVVLSQQRLLFHSFHRHTHKRAPPYPHSSVPVSAPSTIATPHDSHCTFLPNLRVLRLNCVKVGEQHDSVDLECWRR